MIQILFAVFGVLGQSYAAGPGPQALFELQNDYVKQASALMNRFAAGQPRLKVILPTACHERSAATGGRTWCVVSCT